MMKNYFFNPHDYDSHFTVMAPSAKKALQYLKEHMQDVDYWCYDEWESATINDLPEGYTIDTYEVGKVIQGENS